MIVQFCSDWPIQLRRGKQLFCSVSSLPFTQVIFKLFSLYQISVPWLLVIGITRFVCVSQYGKVERGAVFSVSEVHPYYSCETHKESLLQFVYISLKLTQIN